MGFETPRLDDRAFNDIVAEARQRIALYVPEWTDHNLSDPGITLIELFAWMTDIVLYRLNRVPDKHYVRFMELLGIRLHEAEPAQVPVTFWLSAPQPATIHIPDATEVSTTRTETNEAIVFTTEGQASIFVPQLTYLMTSQSNPVQGRAFNSLNIRGLQSGIDKAKVFPSNPPQAGDAMYFGFEQNLSQHIIGLLFEVESAEGAGIDPNNPPYVFEVLGSTVDQNWERVEVEMDDTLGLNKTGMIRLMLPDMRRTTRNDHSAYWLRLRLLEVTNGRTYRVSPELEDLEITSWGITVPTTNVQRFSNELLGRSDGTPGQKFYLTNLPVVARTPNEHVLVRTPDGKVEEWTEVSDFSTSTAEDKHYSIDSKSGEVRFGMAIRQRDGQIFLYGAIPVKDSLIFMSGYRSGGGQRGNVAAQTINILKSSIPYISQLTNLRPAVGGLDAESLDNAKMRVPGYLRSLRRAVTASDYEYLAMEAGRGEVGRVHCLQPPNTNRGEIELLVVPAIPRLQGFIAPESLRLSEELRNLLITYLDERRLLSTKLDVVEPSYQWVETEIRFRAVTGHNPERVREAMEERLYIFLNPITGGMDGNGWPFGRDLFSSDLMGVLLAVPGVEFVRSVKLFPVSYDNGNFLRGTEAQTIPLPSHGTIVSYRHSAIHS